MKDIKQGLEAMTTSMQSQVPMDTLQAFGDSIADLAEKQFGKTSEVGMLFPETKILSEEGTALSVVEFFKGKKVLISFVRGSWCPFCNIEIAHLLAFYEQLKAKGIEVIVVSPMDITLLKQWQADMSMPFAVVQDKDLSLGRALGIDFELQDFVLPHYEALGIDVKTLNQSDSAELVIPAVYLLDEKGEITFRYMDVNYGHRLDLADVLEKL